MYGNDFLKSFCLNEKLFLFITFLSDWQGILMKMLHNACKRNRQTNRLILVPCLEINAMYILVDTAGFIINAYHAIFWHRYLIISYHMTKNLKRVSFLVARWPKAEPCFMAFRIGMRNPITVLNKNMRICDGNVSSDIILSFWRHHKYLQYPFLSLDRRACW